jgi:hypothetical protein
MLLQSSTTFLIFYPLLSPSLPKSPSPSRPVIITLSNLLFTIGPGVRACAGVVCLLRGFALFCSYVLFPNSFDLFHFIVIPLSSPGLNSGLNSVPQSIIN